MKTLKRIFLILFLIVLLIYVTNITSIPEAITLLEGEELNLGTIFGINVKEETSYETVQTSYLVNSENVQKTTATVNLFNIINIKEIEVSTIPETKVIPLGNVIGLKLYTSGVLVVGMTEIEGKKPYENTGISEGDMIVEINEKTVSCTSDLVEFVNESEGNSVTITYIRDGETISENIEPVKTSNNEYKLGLWVRDRSSRYRNNYVL